jgi:hypothetical protein
VSYGDHLANFQRAIESSDATAAMAAARKMQTLGLYDSLQLCRVLAQAHDPLFDRAARRWMVTLAGEQDKTLGDVVIGAAALETLAVEPESEKAWDALAGLVKAR